MRRTRMYRCRTGDPAISSIDFSRVDVLTFDTFGTLIDWELGLLQAFQPVLAPHDVHATDTELLELYARHEADLEAGIYLTYREVLATALRRVCADLGVDPTDQSVIDFAASVPAWRPSMSGWSTAIW